MERSTKGKEEMARLDFLLPKELQRNAQVKFVTVNRPIADFLRKKLEWAEDNSNPPE